MNGPILNCGGEKFGGRLVTTRGETRYGCFLPDLTGLARTSSAANLPGGVYQGRTQPVQGPDPHEKSVVPCGFARATLTSNVAFNLSTIEVP